MVLSNTLLTLGVWVLFLYVDYMKTHEETRIYGLSFIGTTILVSYALLGVLGKAIRLRSGDKDAVLLSSMIIQTLCLAAAMYQFHVVASYLAWVAEALTFHSLKLEGVTRKNQLWVSSARIGLLFLLLDLPPYLLGVLSFFSPMFSESWRSLVPLCLTQTVSCFFYTYSLVQRRKSFQGATNQAPRSL